MLLTMLPAVVKETSSVQCMLLSGSPAGTAVISCAVSTTAAGTGALVEDVPRPRGRNFFMLCPHVVTLAHGQDYVT
jgi:hypothetical protein